MNSFSNALTYLLRKKKYKLVKVAEETGLKYDKLQRIILRGQALEPQDIVILREYFNTTYEFLLEFDSAKVKINESGKEYLLNIDPDKISITTTEYETLVKRDKHYQENVNNWLSEISKCKSDIIDLMKVNEKKEKLIWKMYNRLRENKINIEDLNV